MVQKLKNDKNRDDSLLFSWAQLYCLNIQMIQSVFAQPYYNRCFKLFLYSTW